jgi:hypothetical protein
VQKVIDWAQARQNITFVNLPDRSLDGQCVTLIKAFLAECCDNISEPYSARGNAIDYGFTLNEQGYTDSVYSNILLPGDILVYHTNSQYGHIALYIGNNQIFEENCQLAPATLAYNGTMTSRIGTYRQANFIYRLKKQYYNEDNKEENNMRKIYNKGDGALHWFTDTHFGNYHNYDELQADVNNGVAQLPVIDWSDRSAPWDVRIESTRVEIP